MTTSKLHIIKVEDHEGNGYCGACGRENLKWIVTLSDGSEIGTECAKKTLGMTVSPANHKWVSDFTAIAEHNDFDVTYVLWQHNTSSATRETRNGHLTIIGGVRKTWTDRGWL